MTINSLRYVGLNELPPAHLAPLELMNNISSILVYVYRVLGLGIYDHKQIYPRWYVFKWQTNKITCIRWYIGLHVIWVAHLAPLGGLNEPPKSQVTPVGWYWHRLDGKIIDLWNNHGLHDGWEVAIYQICRLPNETCLLYIKMKSKKASSSFSPTRWVIWAIFEQFLKRSYWSNKWIIENDTDVILKYNYKRF